MALSLLEEISTLSLSSTSRSSDADAAAAAAGMHRWMSSSLLGYDSMVVLECVSVAHEGCRCLEGCYGELLRGRVFQQG